MNDPEDIDLDELYDFALQLGKDAGKLLDDGWRARCNGGMEIEQVEKDNAVDIVTQTDEGRPRSYKQDCEHATVAPRAPKSDVATADP
jgi:hypothetical protein